MVWSRDIETGETTLKPVTGLIRHEREIWEVEVAYVDGQSDVFETTDDHPWWVDDRGWVDTADLESGQFLATKTVPVAEVVRIERTNRRALTFNLAVADFETYFVGEQSVLVHNCSKILRALDGIPWGTYCRTGCEDVAGKIHGAIGGQVHRITPGLPGGRFLGRRGGVRTEWQYHEVVVKDGRVYDALTGPEGATIDEFKKLWEYADDIDFGF